MDEKEKLFLELYCIEKINGFEKISTNQGCSVEEAKKMYKSLNEFLSNTISKELNIPVTPDDVREMITKLDGEIKKYQVLFNRYNTERRKEGFQSFNNFLDWYAKQKHECHYCGTSEDNLHKLFGEDKGVFKPKKDAWKNGSLQIEKLDPDKGYIPGNCVLACVLCNNAKSDLISQDDFITFFKEPMKKYMQKMIELLPD